MQNLGKALSNVGATSLDKRENSKLQKVIDERMSLSEAIEAATRILGCYPNGGANAGDSYIGALASVLGKYPRQVSRECANIPRGIVAECKFLPTVADMVSWCERHTKPLYGEFERQRRVEEQIASRPKPSATSANKQYTYAEFLLMAKRGEVRPRPLGRFESPHPTTGDITK